MRLIGRTYCLSGTCRGRSALESPLSAEVACPGEVKKFVVEFKRLATKLADILHAADQVARLAAAKLAILAAIARQQLIEEPGRHVRAQRDAYLLKISR